jgi:hypothetical protein
MRITLLVTVDVNDTMVRDVVEEAGPEMWEGNEADTVRRVVVEELQSSLESVGYTTRVDRYLVPKLQEHIDRESRKDFFNNERVANAAAALAQWAREGQEG